MGETSKEQEIKERRRKRRCKRQEKKEGKMPNTSLIYLLYIPCTEFQKSFMYVILGVLGLPPSPQTAGGRGRASSFPPAEEGASRKPRRPLAPACVEKEPGWRKRCGFKASFCFPLLVERRARFPKISDLREGQQEVERGLTWGCPRTRISSSECFECVPEEMQRACPGGLQNLGKTGPELGGWETGRWHK